MTQHEKRLELDKILAQAAEYASLEGGKEHVLALLPVSDVKEAERLLATTEEASYLLFEGGAGGIEYFAPFGDALERAEKGAALSCAELLGLAKLSRSARLCYGAVSAAGGRTPNLLQYAQRLRFDASLEEEVTRKIVSEDEVADTASEKLFAIRREMRLLGERVRSRLQRFVTGEEKKYLQDGVVTMRGDRFVVPVKAEYKRAVRGFVHDRSASGATVFIEPEEVLEMNNELKSLALDEREEVERILRELSAEFGRLRGALEEDARILAEVDSYFARAEYCYKTKCARPVLNGNGILEIRKGRHPLLDPARAVPVTVRLGQEYDFLLVSGANTGGKTVTLKTCGLFCLMAACGFFLPAAEGSKIPIFRRIFCDVGDNQSIEEDLSTFSSHVVNMKEILEEAGENCFVLIDEPGGGTDPEEGQALARALLRTLQAKGCKGVVTTHYSALKEFAYHHPRMENASMEFDAHDFRPLYRLKIGAPGASNALAICTRLGIPQETVEEARSYLSEGAKTLASTLAAAETERIAAERMRAEAEETERRWHEKLGVLEREEEKFRREKEKFFYASKAEARRIVAAKTARAEEILAEIEELFQKETVTEADLIRARTLKNKMAEEDVPEETPVRAIPVDAALLKPGDTVFVGTLGAEGNVVSVRRERGEAVVQVGALRVSSKIADLYLSAKKKETPQVQVTRTVEARAAKRECNLIGMTSMDALSELAAFLDAALLGGLHEVRIVHGMGTGKLRSAVHGYLKTHPQVESFRLGKYGEGESGVTIVTLR